MKKHVSKSSQADLLSTADCTLTGALFTFVLPYIHYGTTNGAHLKRWGRTSNPFVTTCNSLLHACKIILWSICGSNGWTYWDLSRCQWFCMFGNEGCSVFSWITHALFLIVRLSMSPKKNLVRTHLQVSMIFEVSHCVIVEVAPFGGLSPIHLSGGIGRRNALKMRRLRSCEFKSRLRYWLHSH